VRINQKQKNTKGQRKVTKETLDKKNRGWNSARKITSLNRENKNYREGSMNTN
jgi:hypothetical protein